MPASLDLKYETLKKIVADTGGLLVAFSGGVDSTLLAKVAQDALGDKALAVTIRSSIHPSFEARDAAELAEHIGIRYIALDADPLALEGFSDNSPERCYVCKKHILSTLIDLARKEGLPHVAEGSNASDVGDFRPGMRAVKELNVLSPLKEADLTKPEIRALSRKLSLPTASKPSYACLASRVPYGDKLTEEKLRAVDAGEDFLREKGYKIVRVRHHGDVARIELAPDNIKRFLENEDPAAVAAFFRSLGFAYVTLDLEGYRTGSLNETL